MAEPIVRCIEAVTHGRTLIVPPADPQIATGAAAMSVLVGFHGYGENAQRHLEQLQRIPGHEGWLLASVQGLHRFYAGRFEEVVASWMTRQDREQSIADNIAYVDRVMAEIARDYPIGRVVFCGFSQGTAMAFRAAVRGTRRAAGIIALGGDIPPDVCELPASRFPPALIGRGISDAWYTAEKLAADVAMLESKRARVQVVVFEGGHEWTGAFHAAAGEFLRST